MSEGMDENVQTDPRTAEKCEKNSHREPHVNWRQVMGCLSITTISFAAGVSMSYSSSLIAALRSPDSEIPATPEQSAWLASTPWLSSPVGAFLSGFLMDRIGRLSTVQLAIVPICLSWILIGTATSFTPILVARTMIGAAFTMGIAPAGVLITETALKKYRGAFSSFALSLHAFGTLCGYTLGAFLHWRTFAWMGLLSQMIPLLLTLIFTAESPLWLRSRGRISKAQKASLYYYGDSDYVVQQVEKPSPLMQTDADVEKSEQSERVRPSFSKEMWILLTSPSAIKPLVIVNTMFFLQHWTGMYIILVYAVTFFKEAGSAIDPYYATIMIGVIRFLASFTTIFLIRHFKRRNLMLISAVSMAICMAASAYTTNWASGGGDGGPQHYFPSWFPVACVVTYNFAATTGLQTVPSTMASELYPRRVRGVAQSVNESLSGLFGFTLLKIYPWLNTFVGGAVGIQYFFAGACLLSAIFVWIVCPETHGKSLTEIEEYFSTNTIYLGHKKK